MDTNNPGAVNLVDSIQGTKKFMAPELLYNMVPYDAYSVDCWATGVTTYYMLFAQFPVRIDRPIRERQN